MHGFHSAAGTTITSNSFQEYSFSDIGLQLDPSSQYIFVLSQPNTSMNDLWLGASSDSSYSGGSLYYFSTTAPQTGTAGGAYNNGASFSATFDSAPGSTNELSVTPVPEARQFILGGLLLCAALAWNFRQDRRKAQATSALAWTTDGLT